MKEEYIYSVEQIDAASWIITDRDVRIFLLAGTEKALLVDSGHGSGDLAGTVAGLTALPVMLVNTHADYDHIGGNAQFEKAFMHPSEFARYRSELAGSAPADVNEPAPGEGSASDKEPAVFPLWEGDVIDLGGRSFEIVLIPGHTPGSIALLDRENRILLGGDSILDDKIAMIGQWRCFDAYICSLEKLISMSDRFDKVYTPHGGFPVSAGILEALAAGAKRCKRGEVEGVETDFIKGAKFYDVGAAIFVY